MHTNKYYIIKLSKEKIKNIFEKCEDKGFLEKDNSIYQDFMKIKDTYSMKIPSIENVDENLIHPLTFFCTHNKAKNGFLIPTKHFINEPERFLKLICLRLVISKNEILHMFLLFKECKLIEEIYGAKRTCSADLCMQVLYN